MVTYGGRRWGIGTTAGHRYGVGMVGGCWLPLLAGLIYVYSAKYRARVSTLAALHMTQVGSNIFGYDSFASRSVLLY